MKGKEGIGRKKIGCSEGKELEKRNGLKNVRNKIIIRGMKNR